MKERICNRCFYCQSSSGLPLKCYIEYFYNNWDEGILLTDEYIQQRENGSKMVCKGFKRNGSKYVVRRKRGNKP